MAMQACLALCPAITCLYPILGGSPPGSGARLGSPEPCLSRTRSLRRASAGSAARPHPTGHWFHPDAGEVQVLGQKGKDGGTTSLLSPWDASHSPFHGEGLGDSPAHFHSTCTPALSTLTLSTPAPNPHLPSVPICTGPTPALCRVLQGLQALVPGPTLEELAVLLRILKLHLSILPLVFLYDSRTKNGFYIFKWLKKIK